ncbi:hypothetical protein SPSIL_053510 [Sporomusa silvacetica DSM 10669]|uniref:Uncharacterized protein n=1 Tax=Sporomusa silvacetica DSM 10669 TaxID=1123289 RepID=A0ABZ3IUA7_9FIRM|nr:hypothetical protein [Sporomusa silvacetica]OZC19560.1 hypothetical protein SPSIL_19880 [Sporomusa silvacetica DSM 10669]
MVAEQKAAKPQIDEMEKRAWPLKGSIVAFASIVYVFLMIV